MEETFYKLQNTKEKEIILAIGKQIFDYFCIQKDLIIKHHSIPITLNNKNGFLINTNRMFASEIGNELASIYNTFAIVWSYSNKNTIACSVRSVEPTSAREIAEQFGGGGHEHAAKFNMNIQEFNTKLLTKT